LAFFGIKGTDWTEKDGKFAGRTDVGNKAFSDKWLDPFSQTVLRVDIVNETYRVNNPSYYVYIDAAAKMPLNYNVFEGIITPEFQTLSADLKKFEDESFIKFVTGKMDIGAYADYVKQWKDRGGEKVQQSMLKELNTRRGTTYTLGF